MSTLALFALKLQRPPPTVRDPVILEPQTFKTQLEGQHIDGASFGAFSVAGPVIGESSTVETTRRDEALT